MQTKRQIERIASDKGRRVSEVFGDWCAVMALAHANAADRVAFRPPPARAEAREAEYMRHAARYGPIMTTFAEMMGELVLELERDPRDVLGSLYMDLGAPNEQLGQFFTPFEVSRAMAQMSLHGVEDVIAERGYVSLGEPACGSGGMVIAAAEVMRSRNLNPQRCMPTHAMDLSQTAVHMAYVQFSLLGIPAQVVHADSLRLETVGEWPVWHTMAWHLGMWSMRNPFSDRRETAPEPIAAPITEAQSPEETGQLALF